MNLVERVAKRAAQEPQAQEEVQKEAGLRDRVISRYLREAEVTRPTPMAGEECMAGEGCPTAQEQAPKESGWNHWEKRGEWNLNLYPQGRRFGWFLKNPKGGGGGSTESSLKAAIHRAMSGTGWGSPHINPDGKTKVWMTVLKWDASKGTEGDWVPTKSAWQDVPKEFIKPPRELSEQERWEMATR